MYSYARSGVPVNSQLRKKFEVNVGAHQGSVLSSLLLIIVLEALNRYLNTKIS